MIVKEIKGNLLDTDLNYIAHGVNCQNKMGSGVAKVLFTEYPKVKADYHRMIQETQALLINGNEDYLGTVQPVEVKDGRTIFNLFTQENYGYDGKLYLSYQAVIEVFDILTNKCNNMNAIAIPKIGCGLAGGDWEIVKKIINRSTGDKLDVYVYYL